MLLWNYPFGSESEHQVVIVVKSRYMHWSVREMPLIEAIFGVECSVLDETGAHLKLIFVHD